MDTMTTKGVDKESIERKKIMTDEVFKRLSIGKKKEVIRTRCCWRCDNDDDFCVIILVLEREG